VLRKDRQCRIAAILLGTSLVLGSYFSGGQGVWLNALFSVLIAVAILSGLAWERLWSRGGKRDGMVWAPGLWFAWLPIPWLLVPAINSGFDRNQWDPVRRLRETAAAERRFDYETTMLRGLPGPVICESLLRCYSAGKPYVYDPFNATRLIAFGKLDATPLIEDLRRRRYAAVQFDGPIGLDRDRERFDPAIEAAVKENYVPALVEEDCEIFVPR
jgi:hypothetical protein